MDQDNTLPSVNADAPTVVDTQPAVTQSPSELETGYDNGATASESNVTEQSPVTSDKSDHEVVEKRASGKLKQVQSEYDNLKRQHEATVGWVFANPERAKTAIKEMRNLTDSEAEQVIGNLKKENPQLWKEAVANQGTPQQYAPPQPQVDPYQAAIDVRDMEKFEELVPDMNAKLNPDKVDEIAELARHVGRIGKDLQEARPGLNRIDAWVQAYKIVSGKSDADIEQAREQGYLRGLARGNGDRATSLPAPTAGKTPSKGNYNFTDEQKRIIQQSGMSEDEYYKYLNM